MSQKEIAQNIAIFSPVNRIIFSEYLHRRCISKGQNMHHWMEFRVKWILTQCKKVFSKNKSFWTNGMGWPYKAESCPSTEEINKTLWQNILYLVKRLWAFEMSVSKRERWAAVVFIGLTSKFFCSSKNSFWFQAQRKQLNLRQENTVAVSTHSIFFFPDYKSKTEKY